MKKKIRKKFPKYLIFVGICSLLLLLFLVRVFIIFSPNKTSQPSAISPSHFLAPSKKTIYPTIYITGSGGNVVPINWLLQNILPIQHLPAKKGLTLLVNIKENNKLTATGHISKNNRYPIIAFATVVGTSQGESYSKALQTAVNYLLARYRVPWINLLGYSSGGTGALYYLMDTGKKPGFPPVKKFVSLDGEYNSLTDLQINENLADILATGPSYQTPMYQYINANYKNINPQTQVLLLEGDYDTRQQTDGSVPWADSFSVYHLLKLNHNDVTATLYPTKLRHGLDCKNLLAAKNIKNFLYGNP